MKSVTVDKPTHSGLRYSPVQIPPTLRMHTEDSLLIVGISNNVTQLPSTGGLRFTGHLGPRCVSVGKGVPKEARSMVVTSVS